MGKTIMQGTAADVARELERAPELAGKTVRLVLVDEGELTTAYAAAQGTADPAKLSMEEFERIMKEGDAYLVHAEHADDSREAIYTRMEGE
jgi:hypothetical protein